MTKPSESDRTPEDGEAETDAGRAAAKDPELVAFGARVRALREVAGLSQEALAHAAGLHWTYVGQIERGERNLTYKNILKLTRGLEVDPMELMRAPSDQAGR